MRQGIADRKTSMVQLGGQISLQLKYGNIPIFPQPDFMTAERRGQRKARLLRLRISFCETRSERSTMSPQIYQPGCPVKLRSYRKRTEPLFLCEQTDLDHNILGRS